MIITFNGDHGSGKSTIAKKIAGELNYPRYCMGQIFRDIARKKGMTLEEFHKLCDENPETDRQVDSYAVDLSKKYKDLVIEGRTLWYFIPESLKIYLKVSDKEGAKRIFEELKRDNNRNEGNGLDSEQEVLRSITERKSKDDKRYMNYYGINIRDEKNYDLVLDTTHFPIEGVFKKVIEFISSKIEK